jgi:hypothetical protein
VVDSVDVSHEEMVTRVLDALKDHAARQDRPEKEA